MIFLNSFFFAFGKGVQYYVCYALSVFLSLSEGHIVKSLFCNK